MYLYESHLGGLYTSENELYCEYLHCEECENSDCEECESSDWLIGEFNTIEEYWNLIKDNCSIDGRGGWWLQNIYVDICKEFNLPIPPLDENYWADLSDNKIIKNIEKHIKESK